MARIRTIKPEFWTDEKLTECSLSARLLFIGTWNFADDAGNLDRSSRQIKARVFPLDSIDCEPLLIELISHGLLIEYSVNDKTYLHIKGFEKHQIINRPSKPSCPPCILTESSLDTHDGREGKGREGKGKENTNTSLPATPKADNVPYEKIVSLYHEKLPTLPKVVMLTTKRKGQIAARWKSGVLPDLETWENYFDFVSKSPFLMGLKDPPEGRKRFVADLEWITNESNFTKIWEKKYHGQV